MDVNEAVSAAKSFVLGIYRGTEETIADLTLQEIKTAGAGWRVTIGFTRPVNGVDLVSKIRSMTREFKQVEIESDGTVTAMTDLVH